MTRHVVAVAQASLAGLPLVRSAGTLVAHSRGPAALARAPATLRLVPRASAPLRLVRRAPAGRVPERVTKFRRNERGSPPGLTSLAL
jgi:hypothetical protein